MLTCLSWTMLAMSSFSAYILYDTQMICKKLSPDEWVLGVVSLYLDVVGRFAESLGLVRWYSADGFCSQINLFLNILRILSDAQRD